VYAIVPEFGFVLVKFATASPASKSSQKYRVPPSVGDEIEGAAKLNERNKSS